jgi:hypothetical protein
MWGDEQRTRFQQLRERQSEGTLTVVEQEELEALTRQLEAAEGRYLAGATQRIRAQREVLETQNQSLELLVQRKERLVKRLGDVLADAQSEREAIESELADVLGATRSSQTDE